MNNSYWRNGRTTKFRWQNETKRINKSLAHKSVNVTILFTRRLQTKEDMPWQDIQWDALPPSFSHLTFELLRCESSALCVNIWTHTFAKTKTPDIFGAIRLPVTDPNCALLSIRLTGTMNGYRIDDVDTDNTDNGAVVRKSDIFLFGFYDTGNYQYSVGLSSHCIWKVMWII